MSISVAILGECMLELSKEESSEGNDKNLRKLTSLGVKDSKKLTAKVREELYDIIIRDSKAWCIAEASAIEIDSINILNASFLAMV